MGIFYKIRVAFFLLFLVVMVNMSSASSNVYSVEVQRKSNDDVAVDSSGNVYATDSGNDRIQKFTSNGTFITKWGSSCYLSDGKGCIDPDGAGPLSIGDGQFWVPVAIAVDSSGNVYVADARNDRIQKFTSNGTFITKWGSLCALFDGKGCIDPDGADPLSIGDGQFDNPDAVAVDSSGNVYVGDSLNARIQVFSNTGTFITKWGSFGSYDGAFSHIVGIELDSSGNVYVADSMNDLIQKFTSNDTFITKWGSYGSNNGEFKGLDDVAVDSLGSVYAVDMLNNRTQKFTSNGTFITKWGSLCALKSGEGCEDPDGAGPLSIGDGQFWEPMGVAVDPSGNVYVSDDLNYRIQKFTSNGTFITKWDKFVN